MQAPNRQPSIGYEVEHEKTARLAGTGNFATTAVVASPGRIHM
jgi:hypothetical protein